MCWWSRDLLIFLNRKYIDMFKVAQASTMILSMTLNFGRFILAIWINDKAIFFEDFHNISFMNYITFQISNQLCWVTMIIHLSSLSKIDLKTELNKYSSNMESIDRSWKTSSSNIDMYWRINTKVKKYEKLILYTFILIMIVFNLLWLYIAFAQLFNDWRYKGRSEGKFVILRKSDWIACDISQFIAKFIHISMIVLHILIIFTELSLLYTLCRLLKRNLNFYYKKNRKNLIILALASSLYFSVSILYFLENDTGIGKVVNRDQIRYLGNYPLDFTLLELLIYYNF